MNPKNLFVIALFLIPVYIFGQNTTYFDTKGKKIKLPEQADYYETEIPDSVCPNRKTVYRYSVSGILKLEKHLIEKENDKGDKKIWKQDGKFKECYDNGQLSKEIDYRNGKIDGQLLTYWENGQLKRRDNYESGKFVVGTCFDSEGNEIKYFPYEIKPQFPGGEKEMFSYLYRMIRYPAYAQDHRIMGRVVVNFNVEKDGRIDDLNIVRSVSPELDSEALRVIIAMPNWTPGLQDGNPVRVLYTLPISFRIK